MKYRVVEHPFTGKFEVQCQKPTKFGYLTWYAYSPPRTGGRLPRHELGFDTLAIAKEVIKRAKETEPRVVYEE